MGVMESIDGLNKKVNASALGRLFQLEERGSTLTTEIKAGTATFLTMAYILAVNPRLLSESGGTCEAPGGNIFAPEYEDCLVEIRRQYVSSTAICSFLACLLMGFCANLPIALAPGMGLNAYFTYNVVGWRGTGDVAFRSAMTAVVIEGAIFLVLALTGVRFAIARLVPEPMRHATAPAIGAFLAHLGFQTAEGLGIVVADIATAVTLGGCPEENRVPLVAYDTACAELGVCIPSDSYTCDVLGGVMSSGTMWIGILGMFIMTILLAYKKNSGIIVGVMFVTIISWFRSTAVTYFPDNEGGDARFEYFSKVVSIEPLDLLMAKYSSDLKGAGIALLTFFYVDFMDTTGTLLGIISHIGIADQNGDFPRSRVAFSVDAISTMFGSLFGLSPITSYIESAAGVEAGGRTGLTAVVCGLYFGLSIFFAPIFASIPPWATGGALVIVGALMCKSLANVQWEKVDHAVTAFVTIMIMPLTYSIAYGLIGGLMCWIFFQTVFKALALVGIEEPGSESEISKVNTPENVEKDAGEPPTKEPEEPEKESSDSTPVEVEEQSNEVTAA